MGIGVKTEEREIETGIVPTHKHSDCRCHYLKVDPTVLVPLVNTNPNPTLVGEP